MAILRDRGTPARQSARLESPFLKGSVRYFPLLFLGSAAHVAALHSLHYKTDCNPQSITKINMRRNALRIDSILRGWTYRGCLAVIMVYR